MLKSVTAIDGVPLWTIDNYARDVAAVVAAEQCGPTVLIGHSIAGAVVTEAASLIESPLAGDTARRRY